MTIVVAVTDNAEGLAALEAAAVEAARSRHHLIAVDLTGGELTEPHLSEGSTFEVVVPPSNDVDEVDQVLRVLGDRDDVSLLVVGVRRRSPIGKMVLGSLPQRLILEADVPVLAVKA